MKTKTPRTDAEATMAYLRGDAQMTEVVPATVCREIEQSETKSLWEQHDPNDGVAVLADALFRRAIALEAELAIAREEKVAIVHSVVDEIGGEDYEGNPTSEINYLQRLRILVQQERELHVLRIYKISCGKDLERRVAALLEQIQSIKRKSDERAAHNEALMEENAKLREELKKRP